MLHIYLTDNLVKKNKAYDILHPEVMVTIKDQTREGLNIAKANTAKITTVLTYSEYILDGIRLAVAKNLISAKQIVIFENKRTMFINERAQIEPSPKTFYKEGLINALKIQEALIKQKKNK